MDVILVPGLWLGGSSWDQVVPPLEAAGHRVRALTLPGLESREADPSGIGLPDHVAAVVAAIDEVPRDRPVVLVGHSLGAGVAWAAADARVDRIGHVILIGGFPSAAGEALAAGFPTEGADLPLLDFDRFDDADLRDLDPAALEAFRRRAVPSPARLTTDLLELHDERRFEIPVTMVCPEFTAEDLRGWVAAGESSIGELPLIRDLTYVDLPTGHWPQWTRPRELAAIIAEPRSGAS